MPPFVPRKREQSPVETPPSAKRPKRITPATKTKRSLFETTDEPKRQLKTVEDAQSALDKLGGEEEDDASSNEVDSDEFEDVPPSKKRKTGPAKQNESDDDQNDEMDWEDVMGAEPSTAPSSVNKPTQESEIGDISVSVNDDGSYIEPLVSMATGKKGPSKRERQIRVLTHCLHVQSLMWHNTIRNSWLNDKDVQKTLVDGLTDGVKREVTRWREAMGTLTKEELDEKKKQAAARTGGKKGRKRKEKTRDWSYDAQHSEQGIPNLSGGDPLLRLLKMLAAYWRKRFTITAPALRKRGYLPLKRMRDEIRDWQKNPDDASEYGERIKNLQEFRELAIKCEGSRDAGAQLFVALLRGIGLETRLVANLQPAGIGWSKSEEADQKKPKKDREVKVFTEESDSDLEIVRHASRPSTKKAASNVSAKKTTRISKDEKSSRKPTRGDQIQPINLDDSDSPLSEPPSDNDEASTQDDIDDNDDDLSVVDVTPPSPKNKKPTKKYDRDLAFPVYWAEVCSPATQKVIPVDPIVLSTIASNDELLQTFEPRGKKAEMAKQVICYVLAFSSDGTAKDVTIRYLKKHSYPGKTKGTRVVAEKVPIYNKRGKVKKYDEYDWFRTVMSLYDRAESKRTAADDLEEQTDLKPFKPVKEDKEVEKESLQWYKQSADYVLEQHLRREEAIVPGSEPVKTFTAGKGDKSKEYDVYRREDVVNCKTVESWHKEGRHVRTGEQPIKHVPMRAVTLDRKREMEEVLRETGEKPKQGLYSWNQTDWIIPPPIENGVIPKNAFGNMDVYVETMVPKGAVHLPLKGTAKLCRKLGIDHAEACTGFEFGKQRAVPVLTGVVVAKENEKLVRDAWRAEQQEIKRKEDTKRTGVSLHWWRKMLMGMRIVERMRAEYDHGGDAAEDSYNPFVKKAKREARDASAMQTTEDAEAGGFFRPGHDEEEVPQQELKGPADRGNEDVNGGLIDGDDDMDRNSQVSDDDGGGFLVEDAEDAKPSTLPAKAHAPVTPISLQSAHKTPVEVSDVDEEGEAGAKFEDAMPVSRDLPPTKKNKRPPSTATKKKTAPRGRSKTQVKLPSPMSESAAESSIPKGDADADELAANNNEYASKSSPPKAHSSPRVLITRQQRAQASRKGNTRTTSKKSTPVKSQYFDDNDEHEDEDDDSSEQEVVKPSRTTARTRRSG